MIRSRHVYCVYCCFCCRCRCRCYCHCYCFWCWWWYLTSGTFYRSRLTIFNLLFLPSLIEMINFSIIKKITLFRHNKKKWHEKITQKCYLMSFKWIPKCSKCIRYGIFGMIWFTHAFVNEFGEMERVSDRQTKIIVISIRHQKFVFIMCAGLCGMCVQAPYTVPWVWQMFLLIWTYLPIFCRRVWNSLESPKSNGWRFRTMMGNIKFYMRLCVCACVRAVRDDKRNRFLFWKYWILKLYRNDKIVTKS